ncbi:IQ domain-containing protein IQM6-like [Tripterygium wilfordii]|uniref:IQ domain-containing protein IQM6-like n=1 Tax=Tripterygium wilfordii TaxID=458696 RepID=UPI0018F81528|nr:IQ domain-containing protein IQM6-like [Tripterygium wilfordii]
MGVTFSCLLADMDDLDSQFEAVLLRSISFNDGDMSTALRSVSFNGQDSEHSVMKSYGSGKIIFEGSLSFKGRELETAFSFKTPTADAENNMFLMSPTLKNGDEGDQLAIFDNSSENKLHPSTLEPGNRRYQAALKLQKVYKSFRTRRKLADCAVLVEQRWWKLLDFAELKRSSISFFDIEKPETAISRWSRARTRAAKVGKGLSKDKKARKLALQHWLEAIDPRHRYGHNLQFYYAKWLHCESKQPFFYWLDIGDGKEANSERCPRSKLHQQCIKYLGPTERQAYEVIVEEGKLVYKQSDQTLDTTGGPKDAKWIFVLSTSKTLYVGQKCKGKFQHSSFLAGGATLSAGRLVVQDGILKAVWPHSGHYLPTEENFEEFMSYLKEHDIDLAGVKKSPTEEEEEELFTIEHRNSIPVRADLSEDVKGLAQENSSSRQQNSNSTANCEPALSKSSRRGFGSKIAKLDIPKRADMFDIFKTEAFPPSLHGQTSRSLLEPPPESFSEDGYETAEESFLTEEDFMVPKVNLFGEDEEEEYEKPIPKEKIMKRIDSHKVMNSYQLAQHLSSKWTTGAGPRIGCMRDYPSELQFRVLEQANLSPRSRSNNASPHTTNRLSPSPLSKETSTGRSPLAADKMSYS